MVLIIASTFMLTGFAIEQAITNTATDVHTSVGGKITLDLDTDNEENWEKYGEIILNGENINKNGLEYHRRHHVTFIFQSYNLIDYMTPVENVNLTSSITAIPILEKVGLTREEVRRNVLKLSGGQQQRVAIARALASDATVLLADEPTGNLDEETAQNQKKKHDELTRIYLVE